FQSLHPEAGMFHVENDEFAARRFENMPNARGGEFDDEMPEFRFALAGQRLEARPAHAPSRKFVPPIAEFLAPYRIAMNEAASMERSWPGIHVSGLSSSRIVGKYSLTVGWMCMVREMAV